MNLPRYRAGPVEYWLSEAATQFVNGALGGVKIGGLIGGGTGVTTNVAAITDKLPALNQLLIAVSGFLVAMIAAGVAQVSRWHESNPFPNPYPKPPQP